MDDAGLEAFLRQLEVLLEDTQELLVPDGLELQAGRDEVASGGRRRGQGIVGTPAREVDLLPLERQALLLVTRADQTPLGLPGLRLGRGGMDSVLLPAAGTSSDSVAPRFRRHAVPGDCRPGR